jgi:uncharacterized protein (TIGR02453 family)
MATADFPGFTPDTLAFFEGLEANNDRDWFLANKKRFQSSVEAPFASLLDAVTLRLQRAELPLAGSRKTMFRMNRDVRFSNDKSPYKTNISALLTPSGTKDEAAGLMYVQLGRAGLFLAAGLYRGDPQQLGPVRDAILAEAEAFDGVIRAVRDAGLAFSLQDSLTGMPRGYTEHADHPHAWALRLKTVVVQQDLSRKESLSADLPERLAAFALGAMPLMRFLREGLGQE